MPSGSSCVCALTFVLAAQLKWVPNLGFSSSPATLHKGSSHISASSQLALPPPSTFSSFSENNDNQNDEANSKGDINDNSSPKDDTNNQYEHDSVTTSPAPEKEPLQLDGNKEHNPFITMFPPRPAAEGEKFLAYLPHSGLHNQLITLENSLRLAAYLNRTLLLPPLYLSHKRQALVWKEPPILLGQWADRNRTGVDYCRDIDPSTWPHKTRKQREAMTEQERKTERECLFYHAWTSTPWTYFYDIPKILSGIVGVGGQKDPIRVFSRPVMSLDWLEEHLNIKDPSTDIYFINDTSRYAYSIVDDSERDYGVKPGTETEGLTHTEVGYVSRYENELLLTDLQRRPEKVLHFGSLFATDRVEARSEKHKALKSYISHGMDLWNQAILDATDLAEKQMNEWSIRTKRAAPEFLGVHFRTEDGIFERLAPKSLQRIVAWLGEMVKQDLRYLNGTEESEITPTLISLESPPNHNPSTVIIDGQEAVPTFLERCMGSPPESPMIFMATDVHQPRHAPLLREFLDQYPCTMFLSDFPESVAILDQIHNPVDGVHMLPYMIALMDANLAAKGREFQGTDKSTFTAYIMNHLWPEYHPERVAEVLE
ncbi:hypothetical protein BGX26_000124 [Mortierella sp. AD094]|nr:hypothetical protein BGX26_000124 [Mortierella sp. AD094]